MIARLLMNLVADIIFQWAASGKRAYEAEVDHYLEARGFVLDRKATPVSSK